MAGIFISICIQNTQQCDKMDKNGQGSGKGIDPVSGQGHPDQYQGLGNQMPQRCGGQVAYHGGGHHNGKYNAHNGVLRAEYV